MVMAEYFSHDRLQDLWHQIHHLHLTFLDMEDSPQKIEQRNKLEVCIREYLCIAPHNRKFYCSETAEVLHRSASNKKQFSGYRAAVAFNALSMYAGNLLSQPWRKEYRQIKTYSGFYKHHINENLVGAEAIFEAMGYKHAGDGVLVLEGPVCPDRVTNVSQDSIVAFVECQILKSIWEEVSASFKISWLDVLEFRESHLCSPEQCARTLKYRYHERHYQQNNSSKLFQHQHHDNPVTTAAATNNPDIDMYGTMYHYRYHPYQSVPPPPPPVPQHTCGLYSTSVPQTPVPCTGNCIYGGNPYYPSYGYVAPPYMAPVRYPATAYHHHTIPPHMTIKPCNGYCNYPTPVPQTHNPSNGYVCPTGQLIELDNSHNGQCMYDTVDAATTRRQQDVESHKQLAKATNLDSLTLSKSKEDGAGTFESWDYVYRNLESQGYYRDLGERPDVLSQQQQTALEKKKHSLAKKNKSSVELEDELAVLSIKDNKNKPEENSRLGQSSSFDNISSHAQTKLTNGLAKKVISPEKPTQILSTLDTKKLRKQDLDKTKPKKDKSESQTSQNWSCNTCTYLNKATVEICAMCGKSKNKVEQILAVGGPECPRCTLVNQKDANTCQACSASLKNSPTYI